jgi:hypothetical protein
MTTETSNLYAPDGRPLYTVLNQQIRELDETQRTMADPTEIDATEEKIENLIIEREAAEHLWVNTPSPAEIAASKREPWLNQHPNYRGKGL